MQLRVPSGPVGGPGDRAHPHLPGAGVAAALRTGQAFTPYRFDVPEATECNTSSVTI